MNRLFKVVTFLGLIVFSLSESHTAETKPRIDSLPMYGQPAIPRPERLKKADAAFIKKAASGFSGDRKAACVAWCEVGDEFFNKMKLDHAMRRYNQAWLLDPNSYLPFWGFGRVALQKDQFQEAVQHIDQALLRCDDARQKPALLSDLASAYSFKARYQAGLSDADKAAAYAKANDCFAESLHLNPDYANGWTRWAMSLHREGRNVESWEKLHQAQKGGAKNITREFLASLSASMPEPR